MIIYVYIIIYVDVLIHLYVCVRYGHQLQPGRSIIPGGYALCLTARSTHGTKIGINLAGSAFTGVVQKQKGATPKLQGKHRKTETKMIQMWSLVGLN